MPIERIIVGVDGSPGAAKALELTVELARATGAEVVAVHAFEPLALIGKVEPPLDFPKIKHETEALLRDEWCRPLADAGVDFRSVVIDADPVGALVDTTEAEDGDLVIVGTRGLGKARALVLGSVASKLPSKSRVPVTIVPPD
jgi:nucleotide-binding universal stress UspA family protein